MRATYANGGLSQYASEHELPLETPDRNQTGDETMTTPEIAKLPQWKVLPAKPPVPEAPEQVLELSPQASVILVPDPYPWAWLRVMMHCGRIPKGTPESEVRAAALCCLLAETEAALPVLRALVENLDSPEKVDGQGHLAEERWDSNV